MKFEVVNGNFGYDKSREILRNVNFSLGDNMILTILGSNGVGKTTLVKCMLGLLKWTKGETLLDGQPATQMKYHDFWKKIGYVPQARLSIFAYTVEEMVLLGRNAHLRMTQLPGEKDRAIALECLDAIGAKHLRHKLCSKISGGELQMVLIARALAAQPSVLILDEPESNLDYRNQLIVLNTIRDLSKQKHISSIVNTHYPEHAISISDMTLILNGDGTSAYGPTRSTITEPLLEKAFGVNVKIRDVPIDDTSYTCIMPVSIKDMAAKA